MKDRELFQKFIRNGDFSNEAIFEIKASLSLNDCRLIRDTFELLNSEIKYLDETQDYIDIIDNCVSLLCIVCNDIRFNEKEVLTNRRRIKKSREGLLRYYHKLKIEDLLISANKLDEIVLNKGIDPNDLAKLIKTLIDKKEDFNIIKKMLNVNKSVITEETNILFDYTFYKAMDALKTNNNDIYYYITLLKIFYSSTIDKTKYIKEIFEKTANDDELANEIYYIIHGRRRERTTDEILDKYNVIKNLQTINIITPDKKNYDDFVLSIDSKGTRLRDDAISLRKDGNYYIEDIHITDASSFIPIYSLVDTQAKINFSCTYLPDNITRIFPQNLEQAFSLDRGKDRKVLTTRVVIDNNGVIQDYDLFENVIRVNANYNFNECDDLLNHGDDKVSHLLRDFYDLATLLEHRNSKKYKYWDKKNTDSIDKVVTNYKSNKIINESMVLNNYIDSCIARDNNYPFTYRGHDKQYILDLVDSMGIKADDDTRKTIERIFLKSYYTLEPTPHYGLNLPVYGQTSCASRKYPDFYNQLLLHLFYFKDIYFEYNPEYHQRLVNYFNQRKTDLSLMSSEYSRALKLERKLDNHN